MIKVALAERLRRLTSGASSAFNRWTLAEKFVPFGGGELLTEVYIRWQAVMSLYPAASVDAIRAGHLSLVGRREGSGTSLP